MPRRRTGRCCSGLPGATTSPNKAPSGVSWTGGHQLQGLACSIQVVQDIIQVRGARSFTPIPSPICKSITSVVQQMAVKCPKQEAPYFELPRNHWFRSWVAEILEKTISSPDCNLRVRSPPLFFYFHNFIFNNRFIVFDVQWFPRTYHKTQLTPLHLISPALWDR